MSNRMKEKSKNDIEESVNRQYNTALAHMKEQVKAKEVSLLEQEGSEERDTILSPMASAESPGMFPGVKLQHGLSEKLEMQQIVEVSQSEEVKDESILNHTQSSQSREKPITVKEE